MSDLKNGDQVTPAGWPYSGPVGVVIRTYGTHVHVSWPWGDSWRLTEDLERTT